MPSDRQASLDDILNRLAGESMLASAGRDDGLIPSYSLLGELGELTAGESRIQAEVKGVYAKLDRLLEAGRPFDESTLLDLRDLVEWVQNSLRDSAGILTRRSPRAGGDGGPARETGSQSPDGEIRTPTASAAPSADELETASAAAFAAALVKAAAPENHDLLAEFFGEAREHLLSIEAALLVLEQHPDESEALNSIFRSFHTIKGNAGFLGLVPMHLLAHEVETLLDLARTRRIRVNPTIVTEILRSRDALLALNQQVGGALEQGHAPDRIIPVQGLIAAVRHLAEDSPEVETDNHLAAVIGDADLSPVPADNKPSPAAAAGPGDLPGAGGRSSAPAPSELATAMPTVRVRTDKLDALMDAVGELVIVQSQLQETARRYGGVAPPLSGNVGLLSRIAKELQHTAMSLRMIPIRPTFQKMERLARDLARECGKQANFTTSGGETELDRTMVEEIADPLVHMVRNALDHGIETPEERAALGKPETGTITLRACHQGGHVIIELQDDGRGLDRDKILDKARRKGLLPEGARPSPDEILNILFLPGFSTADKVTALSGRGVGMDVVKRNIERLRGEIGISSEVGRGSIFTIKLPLTMAIIDGLVVRVGDDRFILPSTSVQRALRPSRQSIIQVQGCGEVLDLQGRMIPLHRLHRLYRISAKAQEPWDGIVVIVESAGKVCALLVDEMVGKQEVVIKNLGGYMQGLSNVAGAAILGDGTIALIIDPGALLQAA